MTNNQNKVFQPIFFKGTTFVNYEEATHVLPSNNCVLTDDLFGIAAAASAFAFFLAATIAAGATAVSAAAMAAAAAAGGAAAAVESTSDFLAFLAADLFVASLLSFPMADRKIGWFVKNV